MVCFILLLLLFNFKRRAKIIWNGVRGYTQRQKQPEDMANATCTLEQFIPVHYNRHNLLSSYSNSKLSECVWAFCYNAFLAYFFVGQGKEDSRFRCRHVLI